MIKRVTYFRENRSEPFKMKCWEQACNVCLYLIPDFACAIRNKVTLHMKYKEMCSLMKSTE